MRIGLRTSSLETNKTPFLLDCSGEDRVWLGFLVAVDPSPNRFNFCRSNGKSTVSTASQKVKVQRSKQIAVRLNQLSGLDWQFGG